VVRHQFLVLVFGVRTAGGSPETAAVTAAR